jgi:hypothetical protein
MLEQIVVAHGYLMRMSNQGELNYENVAREVYNHVASVVDRAGGVKY